MTSTKVFVAVAALALSAGSAAAQGARWATAAEAAVPSAQPWELALGLRSSSFHDPGYDPFSDGDGFGQVALAFTRSFGAGDRFRPALGVRFESGSSDATARAARSHLSLSRLSLALEGRYRLRPALQLFGRLAPGRLHGEASLTDDSAPVPLSTTFSRLALDASGGASLFLFSLGARSSVWLTAEGGYGWADRQTLVLRPQLAAADQAKGGGTSLGSLAARGPFLRLQAALAF